MEELTLQPLRVNLELLIPHWFICQSELAALSKRQALQIWGSSAGLEVFIPGVNKLAWGCPEWAASCLGFLTLHSSSYQRGTSLLSYLHAWTSLTPAPLKLLFHRSGVLRLGPSTEKGNSPKQVAVEMYRREVVWACLKDWGGAWDFAFGLAKVLPSGPSGRATASST